MNDLKLTRPFEGKAKITFKYGENPDWYRQVFGYPHNGVDFAMPVGKDILAVDKGIVSFADDIPDADGCGVIITHSWGRSLYWHLSDITANFGRRVEQGEVLGQSGKTGFATGPHLHFAMKINGQGHPAMKYWVDPLLLLPPLETPAVVSSIDPRYYRVRFGDSLWKIAEKFYRNGAEWIKIYKANEYQIKHPALIFPFQKLLIP